LARVQAEVRIKTVEAHISSTLQRSEVMEQPQRLVETTLVTEAVLVALAVLATGQAAAAQGDILEMVETARVCTLPAVTAAVAAVVVVPGVNKLLGLLALAAAQLPTGVATGAVVVALGCLVRA
jgi:UDP-N-acetylmuramyl tripeptide synthase